MAAKKTPSKNVADAAAPRTFEDSIRRLGEIVDALEEGELPLEQSLTLFEEGVRIARRSQATLDHAEKRVEELLSLDEDGNPIVAEFDSD